MLDLLKCVDPNCINKRVKLDTHSISAMRKKKQRRRGRITVCCTFHVGSKPNCLRQRISSFLLCHKQEAI